MSKGQTTKWEVVKDGVLEGSGWPVDAVQPAGGLQELQVPR